MPKRSAGGQGGKGGKKNLRANPDARGKLKKDPGLPKFGKFAPKRMKERGNKLFLKLDPKDQKTVVSQSSSSLSGVASLAMMSAQKAKAYESKQELLGDDTKNVGMKSLEGFSDGSKRAYYKEFRKVVEACDVILEVLDARDPEGCRCRSIEQSIVSEFGEKKKIVLMLNKVDLVPEDNAQRWIEHLSDEFPVVLFSATSTAKRGECIKRAGEVIRQCGRQGAGVTGKNRVMAGVIGMPNVGKSSIINTLKRDQVVGVGNTPGFTKQASEINLSKYVTIMDCPGIIFANDVDTSKAVLRGGIKIETLEDPVIPVNTILETVDPLTLQEIYKIEPWSSLDHFLSLVAQKKGLLARGGEPQVEETARRVLRDWNNGLVAYFTEPSARTSILPAATRERMVFEEEAAGWKTDSSDDDMES